MLLTQHLRKKLIINSGSRYVTRVSTVYRVHYVYLFSGWFFITADQFYSQNRRIWNHSRCGGQKRAQLMH